MHALGARVRLSLSTNVNTPFFQVPTPELWHRGRARVQGPDLVPWHLIDVDIMGTPCVNTAPFGTGVQTLVLGHKV